MPRLSALLAASILSEHKNPRPSTRLTTKYPLNFVYDLAKFGEVMRHAKFAEWRHRRTVMQEMAMMTDRELSDIGLTRSDTTRVFDSAFAARRWVGQAHIGY